MVFAVIKRGVCRLESGIFKALKSEFAGLKLKKPKTGRK